MHLRFIERASLQRLYPPFGAIRLFIRKSEGAIISCEILSSWCSRVCRKYALEPASKSSYVVCSFQVRLHLISMTSQVARTNVLLIWTFAAPCRLSSAVTDDNSKEGKLSIGTKRNSSKRHTELTRDSRNAGDENKDVLISKFHDDFSIN